MERVEEEREAIRVESMEEGTEEEEWEGRREGFEAEERTEEEEGDAGEVSAADMGGEVVEEEACREARGVERREEVESLVAAPTVAETGVEVEAIAAWERGATEERVDSEATKEGPDRRVEVQTVRHRRWTR